MKPNFALSLSFDGIHVLHRAAGGWRAVGDVALTTDDLEAELAMLRKTASSLDPSGVRSKLLIPNGQIKYLTIDTPGMARRERRAAAEVALHGATPYPVSDLAFDISIDGAKTHVAVVARETLREAESFASEHRFNPVSFVAVPGEEAYLGEPFFGTTKAARTLLESGETVEPDGIAVVIVGSVIPAPAPEPEPQTEPESETRITAESTPEMPEDSDTEAGIEQQTETETETNQPETVEVGTPAVTATQITAPHIPAPAGESEPSTDTPTAGFASRRSDTPERTPSLGGVQRDQTPTLAGAHVAPDSSSLDQPAPARTSAPAPEKPSGGFLSRRKTTPETPAVAPVTTAAAVAATGPSEAERMTVFGARDAQVGGKPRFLGLILTVILLVFLAGVAAWATVFLDNGLAGLLGGRESRATASALENQDSPQILIEEAQQPETVETAALDPDLTSEDTAVLDALAEPQEPTSTEITPQEADARYAVTGIWPLAPVAPHELPHTVTFGDVYLPSVDAAGGSNDAIALPGLPGYETDAAMPSIASPPPAGTNYALDARGMLIPTSEGTISSDGYVLLLASPPQKPPARPSAEGEAATPLEQALVQLAGFRPQTRPGDFSEAVERAQTGGLIRAELAQYRPSLRPVSLQEATETARQAQDDAARAADLAVESASLALQNPPTAEEIAEPVRAAVAASIRPDARPRNFDRIVRRAERSQPPQEEVRTASAATTVAPRSVKPSIPSSASVSRQATVQNAINLRKVNLIGVYGKPSSRRALVRLGNGRYQKVVVGDRIDGGRVSAIGDDSLRYRKGSRDVILKMPKG